MNSLKFRLGVVLAALLGCLWVTYPTAQYFLKVSGNLAGTPEEIDQLRLRSVPLGLDLQGGVDVLLAVNEEKTRASKVENYADALRNRFRAESPAIDADVQATTSPLAVTVKLNKAEQARNVDTILSAMKEEYPTYAPGSVKVEQLLTLPLNERLLTQNISATVDSAVKVIRDRVDNLGVTQPSVAKQGDTRIRVQIPGEKDPTRVMSNVIRPAQLEFRAIKSASQGQVEPQTGKMRYEDESGKYIDLVTGQLNPGQRIPPGFTVAKFAKPEKKGEVVTQQYILVRNRVEMTGADLLDSYVTLDPMSLGNQVQVHLEFRKQGAERLAELSKALTGKQFAILLDGVVQSAPFINEPLTMGRCYIYGNFSQDEGQQLSLVLKAGALPAELQPIEQRTVEATLGADSIKASVVALAIGAVLVSIYMILYYGIGGVIAVFAVLLNVLLVFAFMKLAAATLTLSGIGGILLTMGMAVDANVLIYERIREELKAGKSLKQAIPLGFDRAFSVILDGNLTTLISGLVLLQFGEGSVKGFALALIVGIFGTLFTGLYVTRTLVNAYFAWTGKFSVGKFQWVRDGFLFDFVKMRGASFTFSGALFVVCLLWIMPFKPFPGSNWGVDFEGGLLTEVTMQKPGITPATLQGNYNDWKVQKVTGENQFIIRTKFVDQTQAQITNTQKEIGKRLDQIAGAGQYKIVGNDAVGNEVGGEFTRNAIIATIIASIGILIYMWFRFDFAFGFAAVVALFHDVIITFGLFNILGKFGMAGDVTLDVVSALLVVLGYSVNDTITIFDRVRENMKLHPGLSPREVINRSICESINRTVSTGASVIGVLIIMLIFGGAGLSDFALVLLIGLLKGTYSSSFIASPILYIMMQRAKDRNRGVPTVKVARAQ